jgi:hypothetical protein
MYNSSDAVRQLVPFVAPSSSGLGRRPLTPVTRVRIPLGLPVFVPRSACFVLRSACRVPLNRSIASTGAVGARRSAIRRSVSPVFQDSPAGAGSFHRKNLTLGKKLQKQNWHAARSTQHAARSTQHAARSTQLEALPSRQRSGEGHAVGVLDIGAHRDAQSDSGNPYFQRLDEF